MAVFWVDARRRVILDESLTREVAARVEAEITRLQRASPEPIFLMIDSSGGWRDPTIGLLDFIKEVAVPIIGVVSKSCQSSATLVLEACDKRVMLETATLVFHSIRVDICMPLPQLVEKVDEIVERAKAAEAESIGILSARTGLSRAFFEPFFSAEVTFSAKVALGHNLIDEIASSIEIAPEA